jgi:hypothetical protein
MTADHAVADVAVDAVVAAQVAPMDPKSAV